MIPVSAWVARLTTNYEDATYLYIELMKRTHVNGVVLPRPASNTQQPCCASHHTQEREQLPRPLMKAPRRAYEERTCPPYAPRTPRRDRLLAEANLPR